MKPMRRAVLPLLFIALVLSTCGGGTNEPVSGATGNVSVALTDRPSYAFDNVWVTVRRVWFHKVATAPFDNTSTAWVRFTLDNGVTVNLAALSGDNNVRTIFDNLALPTGTYQQMLLFLEPTENARTVSATAAGLTFNNQVDNGALHAALRVPNAAQGVRIAGPFTIVKDTLLSLAIDFDIGRDVLPFHRGAVREFLLQPRPAAFDLGTAGAIVGFIDTAAAADNTALFEVLAEQADATGVRSVRRTAAIDNATGKFVLYPLPPGTLAGQLYDIVIRGIGKRTAIVKAVPVTAGTTPASLPTVLGTAAKPMPIDNATVADFPIAATSVTTGALAKFYQDIGPGPCVIRQVNFNPLTGTIDNLSLSGDQVNTVVFNQATFNGGTITLTPGPPSPAIGKYWLVAEAPLYDNSATSPTGGIVVSASIFPFPNPAQITAGLNPTAPAVPTAVNVDVTVPSTPPSLVPMDNVVLFATFGGTILNAQPLGPVPGLTVLNNAIVNLPGGSSGTTFSMASYGISAFGWATSADNVLRVGPQNTLGKPQTGDASVSFTLQNVTGP